MLSWRTAHERRLDPDSGDLAHIKGWMSRAPGNAYRIAALLHLAAGHSPRTLIGPEPMTDALAIINYCVPHVLAILGGEQIRMHGRPSWVQAACSNVLEWIRKKGMTEFTASHLSQALKKRSWVREHGAAGARVVLLALASEGWLATVARQDAKGRKLADPLFVAHPELLGGDR
jgi:hypothetical protein